MDITKLGQRIRDRREALGAKPAAVATWSGLSEERISAFEDGQVIPSALEFDSLCRGLAVDAGAFYRGEEIDPRRSFARFRSAVVDDSVSSADLRLLALAAEAGRLLATLLSGMDRTVLLEPHRRPEPPRKNGQGYWRAASILGEQARVALFPDQEPIYELETLFTQLGIHIARVDFSSSDIDAASIWEPGAVPIILLNSNASRVQYHLSRRAVLGHELCHILHDATRRGNVTTRVSWTEGTGNYIEAEEIRARAFSPAFLAPKKLLLGDWIDGLPQHRRDDPRLLARAIAIDWGLSFEGAVWHAKSLRLIRASDANELARQGRRERALDRGGRFEANEILSLTDADSVPAQPQALMQGFAARVVADALRSGTISKGRAREILSWT